MYYKTQFITVYLIFPQLKSTFINEYKCPSLFWIDKFQGHENYANNKASLK